MSAVIVSLRVATTPEDAFDIFTGEIGLWWQPGALFQLTPRGDGTLSFEGETRLITTLPNGKVFEIGHVTAWERGQRLGFSWRQATFSPDQLTQAEVRFEAVGEQTRVTVEHRGWDTIPQDHVARHGFPLAATQMRLAEYWRAQLASLSLRRKLR
ncbi:SRPBCC domain-containing protein [Hyphomonas sp. WL0036]|uniref:SRPBCC domain-containing protein n=1 Tax=Hyphomonas sediminis TaxID=2866160 RepID=UPI001C802D33|nr:SRPBCC domain-containing protein [Hyphomonas sediminis]